jgi:hypothetical protein
LGTWSRPGQRSRMSMISVPFSLTGRETLSEIRHASAPLAKFGRTIRWI